MGIEVKLTSELVCEFCRGWVMVLGLAVNLHSSVRVQDYQGLRGLLAGRTYVIEKINLFTKPFDVIREITLSL